MVSVHRESKTENYFIDVINFLSSELDFKIRVRERLAIKIVNLIDYSSDLIATSRCLIG